MKQFRRHPVVYEVVQPPSCHSDLGTLSTFYPGCDSVKSSAAHIIVEPIVQGPLLLEYSAPITLALIEFKWAMFVKWGEAKRRFSLCTHKKGTGVS